ncbi:MAG: hypothetical protein ACXWUI_03600 [Burkholderiales bacterium]
MIEFAFLHFRKPLMFTASCRCVTLVIALLGWIGAACGATPQWHLQGLLADLGLAK